MKSKQPKFEGKELTDEELASLKAELIRRRDQILQSGAKTLGDTRESGGLRYADEVDLAAAEWDAIVEQRMRSRDKGLLKKIDKALKRIEDGEYGECENFDDCGNYIGFARLEDRPEASLCITCKREQELLEKKYVHRRDMGDPFSFDS